MDIGPGDWLQCLESYEGPDGERIVVNRMYCVARASDVVKWSDGTVDPSPGVTLTQPETHWTAWDGDDGWWALAFFRPAGRGGMFNDLLTAKPVRVGEDA